MKSTVEISAPTARLALDAIIEAVNTAVDEGASLATLRVSHSLYRLMKNDARVRSDALNFQSAKAQARKVGGLILELQKLWIDTDIGRVDVEVLPPLTAVLQFDGGVGVTDGG